MCGDEVWAQGAYNLRFVEVVACFLAVEDMSGAFRTEGEEDHCLTYMSKIIIIIFGSSFGRGTTGSPPAARSTPSWKTSRCNIALKTGVAMVKL